MEDNKFYCSSCDWFFKPSEVNEDDEMDPRCEVCGGPLDGEVDPYD